ncbi:MAG TPA: ABC transporter ATP-binding protein, partial [Hyphomicrobiales bacterium]|nr:ABC transporter ATP-binding protein [Hyphomicrobiales bacterium]
IGANGAGKSTLLKALAGLLPVSSGTITLQDQPLASVSGQERARRLAYLEQQPQSCWPLAAERIVALGLQPQLTESATRQRIAQAMAATGCDGLQARPFPTLSTGERLQVHLARVLAADTPLVLADEPTAALDLWHQHHLLQTLQAQCRQGKGMVVAMHELDLAARYCSRLLLLHQGRQVACDVPARVLTPALLAECYRVRAHIDETGALIYEGQL